MSICWLRYQNGSSAVVSMRFDARELFEKPQVNVESGLTRRGFLWRNKIGARSVYDVSIGADQLMVDANWAFIEAFWRADAHWISLSTGTSLPSDGTFLAVMGPSDVLNVTYLRKHKQLRSVQLTLTEKAPS